MSEEIDYFLAANTTNHVNASKPGNSVSFFVDNRKLYASILTDLITADGKDDFVYFANWWCDVDIPLGDPNSAKLPLTLGQVLSFISAEKTLPPLSSSELPFSELPPLTARGAQVCALLWRHKGQHNLSALPVALFSLPVSIFGDPFLASINTKAFQLVGGCSIDSKAIIDGDHRLFGCHHQKLLIVKNKDALVAYVGSTDFNADRLYPKGTSAAKNPPSTAGGPLEDVSVRIVGPVAGDVLKTFIERWKLHPEGQNHKLRGESYTPPQASFGSISAQVTHTYGKDYPFKGLAVRSAADAILKMIANAKKYIYFEDQYLIGTTELFIALRNQLSNNLGLNVIAVMAPLDVVGDLPWLNQRRSDFWRSLINNYPSRVKVYEMTNVQKSKSGNGSYLHAKLTIVDDTIASVGSVNFSNRSWYHDSEILISFTGSASDNDEPKALAARLRLERWSRHLGISKREILNLGDGISKWNKLPSAALVQQWIPQNDPLSYQQNSTYGLALDPI